MEKLKKLFLFGSIGIVFIFIAALFITLRLFNQSESENLNSTENEKLIIGFSQIGTESSWRIQNTKSIFDAAKARNIEILYDDAKQKQSNQLKAIRSFIVYQVDVIVFVPIVSDGWDNVLQDSSTPCSRFSVTVIFTWQEPSADTVAKEPTWLAPVAAETPSARDTSKRTEVMRIIALRIKMPPFPKVIKNAIFLNSLPHSKRKSKEFPTGMKSRSKTKSFAAAKKMNDYFR